MEIRADQVSAEFLEMPDNEAYVVHSCFEHGINILAGDLLCFAGNKHSERLPYGILLGKKEISLLKDCTEPGVTVFYKDKGRIRARETEIVLCEAGIYSSFCSTCGGKSKRVDLPEIFSEVGDECTGFGSTVQEMAGGSHSKIKELEESFRCTDPVNVRRVLKKWVGLGPGLTPSGDDYLLGILFAGHLVPFLGEVFREELQKIADTFHTTAVSVSQYTCAFHHYFCGSLLKFKQAYEAGDIGEMKQCIRNLLLFGHTSGRDMTAGLWMGLRQA